RCLGSEEVNDGPGSYRSHPGYGSQRHQIGLLEFVDAGEARQQSVAALGTDTWHVVEDASGQRLPAALPVVADRDAVRLVAHVYEQLQSRVAVRHYHLFACFCDQRLLLLGEPDQRYLDAGIGKRASRCAELSLAAIDEQ